ncbi:MULTISPECIES: YgjV family protein [Vibrio]|uniref:Inner membrane protein n=1 Tax=Vibrio diazotrophicus TaxID=685 RepID=A0A329EL73_VIBDI|nr:YgjV family protein [Vibrio diazotrophicus]RAS65180.1 inner membrane protein [Vibrio diazotrophicus]
MDFSLAQALGLVSFALGISTFYQKDDRKLKIIMLIFNMNHLLHYLLLGSMTSALSAALSAARTGTSIYTSSRYVAAVFIVLGLSLGLSISNHWWDMWPIVGTVIGTFAVFMLRGIAMRIAFLVGGVCWLINNIIVGSIGGTMLEATLICVNLLTMFRLVRDTKKAVIPSEVI